MTADAIKGSHGKGRSRCSPKLSSANGSQRCTTKRSARVPIEAPAGTVAADRLPLAHDVPHSPEVSEGTGLHRTTAAQAPA